MPNSRRDRRSIGIELFVVNLLKCQRNLLDCLRFAYGAMLRAAIRDKLNPCPIIVAPGASAAPGSLP